MRKSGYWWRYALATIVFVLLFFITPTLLLLLLKISEFFYPAFMKSNAPVWTSCLAHAAAAYAVAEIAEKIVEEKRMFLGSLCVIAAMYSIFVSAWNWALGFNTWATSVPLLVGGVFYIIEAISYFAGKRGEEKQ